MLLFRVFVSAFALCAVLALGPASAAERVSAFKNPVYNGLRLDWCYRWGEDCGQPAADAYCKNKGYDGAKDFVRDPAPGKATRMLSNSMICNDESCASFSTIRCVKRLAEPAKPIQRASQTIEQNLGGTMQGDVSITTYKPVQGDTRIAIFARGSNDSLWWRSGSRSGENWTDWQNLGGIIRESPSCATLEGRAHCFAIGPDKSVWWTVQSPINNGPWHSFQSIGGIAASAAAAATTKAASGATAMHVFVRGEDGMLQVNSWESIPNSALRRWTGWRNLGLSVSSAPVCTDISATSINCYYRNNRGETVQMTDVLHQVSAEADVEIIGGKTESRPDVIVPPTGRTLRLIERNVDGHLWFRKWDPANRWNDWKQLPHVVGGAPACAHANPSSTIWCAYRAEDGVVKVFKLSTAEM